MLEKCLISGFADEIADSIDTQLRVLGELGVKYLEFRGGDGKGVAGYTIEEAKRLKEKLDMAGVQVSAIGSPIGKIGIRDDFEPHLEQLKHICNLARILGTRQIRMFSFYLPQEAEADLWREEVLHRLKEMIACAKANDVVLLHENEKGIYGDVASRCLDLFRELSCENFKCTFDFANFIQCGQDTMEAYEMLRPYISYIHIKDACLSDGRVVPAGEGDGQVRDILKRLDEDGYQGFLSLEPHLNGFEGLKNLSRVNCDNGVYMEDGECAWKLAHKALMQIIGR